MSSGQHELLVDQNPAAPNVFIVLRVHDGDVPRPRTFNGRFTANDLATRLSEDFPEATRTVSVLKKQNNKRILQYSARFDENKFEKLVYQVDEMEGT